MNEFDNDYSDVMTLVQETAEQPTPEFKALLDARVSAGFPTKPKTMVPFNFGVRRPRLAVIGVAASALLALTIAVSIDSQTDQRADIPSTSALEDSSGGAGGGVVASTPAAPAQKQESAGASEDLAARTSVPAPLPEPPIDNFIGGQSRRVQRSAAMTLGADEEKLGEVGDQVISVTDRYRGFVQRSSVTSSEEGGTAGGSFDVRIPVRNMRAAIRDLSALATVKSRTENADDVTASFRGARERLQELQSDRRGLLRRLEKAETETAANAIRARIRIVNAEIDAQNAALQDIRRRTAYAAIAITLVADEDASSGGGGIGDGARDLRDSLIESANLALRVLGVAIPLALVASLMWLAFAGTRRRRREAALG